jgi:hypothetical protein
MKIEREINTRRKLHSQELPERERQKAKNVASGIANAEDAVEQSLHI